jgi:UDP-2,4-diacetamido-2,4,6-trideoxy-beta-L-altropyranose hydrolase
MRCFFRFDKSPRVGSGHYTRCLALARALRKQGGVIAGALVKGPDEAGGHALEGTIPVSFLSPSTSLEEDIEATLEGTKKAQADFLILDSYDVTEAYQQRLLSAGVRWLQFEGQRRMDLWADYILDANPGVTVDQYTCFLKNENCRVLAGSRYAIMRDQFENVPPPMIQEKGQTLLITLGGGDDRGESVHLLRALRPLIANELRVVVVSGSGNPSIPSIRQWIQASGCQQHVQLLVNPVSMVECLGRCDAALISGGGISYEAAACGVPMIIVALAANQMRSEAWERLGAGLFLGMVDVLSDATLVQAVSRLMEDAGRRRAMSLSGRTLVDGHGAWRTAEILMGSHHD